MPDKSSKKKRKKSFLGKFSRAFGRRKKKNESKDESSLEDESCSSDDRETSNCSTPRSRSRTPVVASQRRTSTTDVTTLRPMEREINQEASNFANSSREMSPNIDVVVVTETRKCEISSAIIDFASPEVSSLASLTPPREREFHDPETKNFASNLAGSDKNYEAKKLFMRDETQATNPLFVENLTSSSVVVVDEKNHHEKTESSKDFQIIGLRDVNPRLDDEINRSLMPEIVATREFMKKLARNETRHTSDSDSEDWTDTESEITDDDNNDFIHAERDELDYEELYFTKGKYMSYFFLQMERQSYDPNDVYTIIRYRKDEKSNSRERKGENSSSGSTSPNIPSSLRRRLLHRRSADNIIANSPTNSMRHSSPESIRSAPIPLKPRSTSHDALSKKNKIQATGQTDGASMDSLAKRALLAAQVLNLIPTQKARERNFLHGRVAANSLLGPVELEKVLPNREIRIFVGTWNMNGQTPPKELNDFMLPSDIQTVPDMLAIGTQESCSERSDWEAALQETLGPSHVLLTSTGLGTLHLALFIRRDLIWFCSVPEDDNFSTRPGTAFRTKGAVALALMLFGTSFLFVTAHLTAHQEKVKERVNDIKRIVRNLELPKDLPTRHKSKDVTQNFDCVFWCGDLNFRLAQPREEVIQWISDTSFPRQSPINLHKDQLRTILNEGAVLRGFEEAPITFPPTYKYDPGTQNFDTSSKQRTPAYTDRILFKGKAHSRGYIRRVSHESTNSHKDGIIECMIYDSVPSICTSDHKPVWGVFKTTVRPGIDTIPLAAGLFNRDVYLEGIKRRAAAMGDCHNATSVCSIQ